jgi:hypothetical protein
MRRICAPRRTFSSRGPCKGARMPPATLARLLARGSPSGRMCPVDWREQMGRPSWPNETIFPDREVVPQQIGV